MSLNWDLSSFLPDSVPVIGDETKGVETNGTEIKMVETHKTENNRLKPKDGVNNQDETSQAQTIATQTNGTKTF